MLRTSWWVGCRSVKAAVSSLHFHLGNCDVTLFVAMALLVCFFQRGVFFPRQGAGSGRGPPPHRGRPLSSTFPIGGKAAARPGKAGKRQPFTKELEFTSSLLWPRFALFCSVATTDLGACLSLIVSSSPRFALQCLCCVFVVSRLLVFTSLIIQRSR